MSFCGFGKEVKKKLVDIDQTQKWLMGQITERTGLYMDGFYLHKILTGQCASPKIVTAIKEILDLPGDNEDQLAN